MRVPDYNSPTELKAFLEARGMAMRKKFGQNFLVNPRLREKLIDTLGAAPGDAVWEVGPGLGAMTALLLERGCKVTAFEIDRGFAAVLRELFGDDPRFTLIEGDALKTWRGMAASLQGEGAHLGEGRMPLLFGNLPYNIAATLIADFTAGGLVFPRAVATVQSEVAERICARPASRAYSAFSVVCRRFYDSSVKFDMAAGSFWPRPNVASSAVLMQKKERPAPCKDNALFFAVVRALFSSRRKTAKNTLSAWIAARLKGDGAREQSAELAKLALKQAGIAEAERPENLPPEAFCALADALLSLGISPQSAQRGR